MLDFSVFLSLRGFLREVALKKKQPNNKNEYHKEFRKTH